MTTMASKQSEDSNQALPAKPFLRWAGGKSRIVRLLMEYAPKVRYPRYWEPFLGAASLFFSLAPGCAHLSDSNAALIHCYEHVRDHPSLVFRYLKQHIARNSETYYYQVRDVYNDSQPSAAQAARFLYLNKTSFNGIFRVNAKGQYNVPYGRREHPSVPSLREFLAISNVLKNVFLSTRSYDIALADGALQPGDFVYLDPPYPAINETSYFAHYTPTRFSWQDQENTALHAKRLKDAGCLVMISNADLPRIRELYEGWEIHTLPVVRWIAANGSRHKVSELVITTYPTER